MSRSVLIVDDNSRVRKIMRQFFETLTDWVVAGEAGDGSEAIEKARKLRPDLILLDFSMPNLNGVESASILKKMLPRVSIIMFTFFDGAVGTRLSSAVGVDLVVPKANGLTGLVKAIRQLLGQNGMLFSNGADSTPGTARE